MAAAGGVMGHDRITSAELVRNTSDVEGDTVRDALNTLLGSAEEVQLFTSSDTYSPTDGVTKTLVIGQAAGGGGGGVGTTSGTGRGGHGGAGETRIGVFAVSGDVTVTIGAAGTGGAAGNNAGSTASDSTFGSDMTCKGGTGGGGSTGANNGTNGSTGTGSGGIQVPSTTGAVNTLAATFHPAGTIFSDPYQVSGGTNTTSTGGSGKGGGGVGGLNTGTTAAAGGDGAGGMFIVIGFK